MVILESSDRARGIYNQIVKSYRLPDIQAGNCSNDDRKDAYTYLGLQIKATREGADIKVFLDPGVLTTGQTWDIRIQFLRKASFSSILVNEAAR